MRNQQLSRFATGWVDAVLGKRLQTVLWELSALKIDLRAHANI